jgi:hypothetical protein
MVQKQAFLILEKDIERILVKEIKSLGGICLKYFNPNSTGWPDRLVILPGGDIFFVELKRPGGKISSKQEVRLKTLQELGVNVAVIWSIDDVKEFIRCIKEKTYTSIRGMGLIE